MLDGLGRKLVRKVRMLDGFRRTLVGAVFSALVLLMPQLATVARAQEQTEPTAAFPLTVTDDSGISATFAGPPQRIVSLNPGLTEITVALGAGPRLVAVDTYSDFPAEAAAIQTRLTTFPSPSIETIVALKPDVVLDLAERDEDLTQLRRQGIPVLKLFPRDFDATVHTITTLGRLFGTPETADAIAADMLSRRDAVVAAVGDAPRPRVYEELDASAPDKPFVAGPNGFYGQLIDVAGGSNIFGDLPGDFGQVGAESVVERDPEVIILTDSDLPFNPQTPELVAGRPGWQAITAVRNGAIYSVSAALYSSPGPRLIDGLEALAALLHPERFPSPAARHPTAALAR